MNMINRPPPHYGADDEDNHNIDIRLKRCFVKDSIKNSHRMTIDGDALCRGVSAMSLKMIQYLLSHFHIHNSDHHPKGFTMQVPFLDFKAQYATIRDEIEPAIQDVLESQMFINGPAVKELEAAVASFSGCPEGIGVSSGTDAILAALMALGIGKGDEVITTPFTFFATAGCIWRTGARPVFVDIEPDTFNIDVSKIPAALTERTISIMPVHVYGQIVDMDPLMEIAKSNDLAVIEDACQAIGAEYKGRRAGSIGDIGCFSFYPTKNLGGIGDGGMMVTQDTALAERLRIFRNHGQSGVYMHEWVGGNFRLDTVQAAALVVKLKHLNAWSERRRAIAAIYNAELADCAGVKTPVVRDENLMIYHQYVIRAQRRDGLKAFLADKGIGSNVYYPLSLHEQECFKKLGYKKGDFPESERACAEVLALPIFPELSDEQVLAVAAGIREFCA
jgi:dTDP-4-amino-4,6-dideoxygalactose transaminase